MVMVENFKSKWSKPSGGIQHLTTDHDASSMSSKTSFKSLQHFSNPPHTPFPALFPYFSVSAISMTFCE